jgi:DNA polymerase V
MTMKCDQVYHWTPAAPQRLALFIAPVAAGFPSPADDYVECGLDLNQHLVKHPAATFFVRVRGQSMVEAGIHDGDLLVVDRALEARDGSVVIAVLNGELTVKRIRRLNGQLLLCPENADYLPIAVPPESDVQIWGLVVYAIHQVG